MLRKSLRLRFGFTLVEIMVAIFILSLLVAIAVPNMARARDVARGRACQSNLKNILGAKERWAMDNNRGATNTPSWNDIVVPGLYLRFTPECPGGGTYTIGRMDEMPECSIGGPPGAPTSHILD